MADQKEYFEYLKAKMEEAGFRFEKEQKPYNQHRKKLEMKFIHPELEQRFELSGFPVKAKKYYIKPLTDDPGSDIGFVTGSTSSLLRSGEFIEPNAADSHRNQPAWVNN